MRISDWSSDVCSSDLCSQRLDATDPAQNELRSAPADYHRGCTWINAAKPVRRSQGAWFKTVTHNTIRRTVLLWQGTGASIVQPLAETQQQFWRVPASELPPDDSFALCTALFPRRLLYRTIVV